MDLCLIAFHLKSLVALTQPFFHVTEFTQYWNKTPWKKCSQRAIQAAVNGEKKWVDLRTEGSTETGQAVVNSRQQEKILDTLEKKIHPDEEAKDRKRDQDKNNSKRLDSRLQKISFLDLNRLLA